MSFWKLFRKWIRGGCVWYAVVSLAILLVGVLTDTPFTGNGALSFLLIFPFGLSVSAAGLLYRHKPIARWIRILSHYSITVVAFLVFLLLPNMQGDVTGARVLIMLFAISVVYWFLYLLVHIFRKRLNKLLEEEE